MADVVVGLGHADVELGIAAIYFFNLVIISGDYAANQYGNPRTVPTENPELYLNDNY